MMEIPRKLCIDDAMKSAELMRVSESIEVFVDGQKQDACVSYDMDEGFITRLVADPLQAGWVTETVRGKVEVREKV